MVRLALAAALALMPGIALAGGWDVFGPDGSYQGRISGQDERGLSPVIGGQDAR
jgi:hypothetical protein